MHCNKDIKGGMDIYTVPDGMGFEFGSGVLVSVE